jgi:hypothetical protein
VKEKDRSKNHGDSVAPSVTQGGVMPGGNENKDNANAYPRADATLPVTLPPAVADAMGDPTGDKSRDQLFVIAQELGLDVSQTMTRADLAEAVRAGTPA